MVMLFQYTQKSLSFFKFGVYHKIFELIALKLLLEKKWQTDFSLYTIAYFSGIGMHYCQGYQVL